MLAAANSPAQQPPSQTREVFPAAWREVLRREVAFHACLSPQDRARLEELIQRFMAAKQWWGAEGLVVTDEMKVIVAAYACLLVLGSDRFGLFPHTREIILYPREFGERVQAVAPDGTVLDVEDVLLGESHYRGPVLLAWDSIQPRRDSRSYPPPRRSGESRPSRVKQRGPTTEGYVILHEFAHALDSVDASWTGESIGGRDGMDGWIDEVKAEYEALVRAVERGRRTFLDPYAAQNPAEFFAVATESFFEEPVELKRRLPRLYERLSQFYGQDPASWTRAEGED